MVGNFSLIAGIVGNILEWCHHLLKTREMRSKKRLQISKHCSMTLTALSNLGEKEIGCWRLQPERFSSWRKLTRVTAWTFRFINNCKQDKKIMEAELYSEEICYAVGGPPFIFIFNFFPGLDGLPLPPPPALGGKVLDSWEY